MDSHGFCIAFAQWVGHYIDACWARVKVILLVVIGDRCCGYCCTAAMVVGCIWRAGGGSVVVDDFSSEVLCEYEGWKVGIWNVQWFRSGRWCLCLPSLVVALAHEVHCVNGVVRCNGSVMYS